MRAAAIDRRFGRLVHAGSPVGVTLPAGLPANQPMTMYAVIATPAASQRVFLALAGVGSPVISVGRTGADTGWFTQSSITTYTVNAPATTGILTAFVDPGRAQVGLQIPDGSMSLAPSPAFSSGTISPAISTTAPQAGFWIEFWHGAAHPAEVRAAFRARLAAAHL